MAALYPASFPADTLSDVCISIVISTLDPSQRLTLKPLNPSSLQHLSLKPLNLSPDPISMDAIHTFVWGWRSSVLRPPTQLALGGSDFSGGWV